MGDTSEGEITRVLQDLRDRAPGTSADELLPLVYHQRRALARARMAAESRGRPAFC